MHDLVGRRTARLALGIAGCYEGLVAQGPIGSSPAKADISLDVGQPATEFVDDPGILRLEEQDLGRRDLEDVGDFGWRRRQFTVATMNPASSPAE